MTPDDEPLCGFSVEALAMEAFNGYPRSLVVGRVAAGGG